MIQADDLRFAVVPPDKQVPCAAIDKSFETFRCRSFECLWLLEPLCSLAAKAWLSQPSHTGVRVAVDKARAENLIGEHPDDRRGDPLQAQEQP